LLELFVSVVDAKLLKAVILQYFEPEYIKDLKFICLPLGDMFAQLQIDSSYHPRELGIVQIPRHGIPLGKAVGSVHRGVNQAG
jgi:hypothetical protein